MKKIIFFAAAAIVWTAKAYSQQMQPTNERLNNSVPVKDYPQPVDFSVKKGYTVEREFIVKYSADGIDYKMGYDKKGHRLYTIRSYNENELPQDIRNIVKSSYGDCYIKLVEEIEKPGDTFTYIIHLEGKKDWINLRVCNGEMDEWQKFNKSK